jgi:hypothetical protein
MENHFDLSINYAERLVEIKLQRLSKELPKIIYAVWPKDEDLKNILRILTCILLLKVKKTKMILAQYFIRLNMTSNIISLNLEILFLNLLYGRHFCFLKMNKINQKHFSNEEETS